MFLHIICVIKALMHDLTHVQSSSLSWQMSLVRWLVDEAKDWNLWSF